MTGKMTGIIGCTLSVRGYTPEFGKDNQQTSTFYLPTSLKTTLLRDETFEGVGEHR